MKKSHHEILRYIYDNDDAGIRELSNIMKRKHQDHRDFYGLAALLDAGYVGFTGPVHLDEHGKLNTYKQVRLFQAYSQGEGRQEYDGECIVSNPSVPDSFLYIGHKGIEYFHDLDRLKSSRWIAFAFALISAILSGIIVSHLTVTAVQVIPAG
ncbi:hypothetical protein [Vibrio mediterranei]|uniref:hypothetical protein n=1 Tax=Vibrio mediterranei TaxID=689 RepID=UPI0040691C7B